MKHEWSASGLKDNLQGFCEIIWEKKLWKPELQYKCQSSLRELLWAILLWDQKLGSMWRDLLMTLSPNPNSQIRFK